MFKIAIAAALLAVTPTKVSNVDVLPMRALIGFQCNGVAVSTYDHEDEFPAPCAVIMPVEDYCFTDSGVEDPICKGHNFYPDELDGKDL